LYKFSGYIIVEIPQHKAGE